MLCLLCEAIWRDEQWYQCGAGSEHVYLAGLSLACSPERSARSLTCCFISACDGTGCSSVLYALFGQVKLRISSLELGALPHTHTDIHTHSCTQRTPVLRMFIQGWPCAALSDKGAVKSTVDSGSAGEHVSRCLFNNLFTVNTLTASLTPFTPYYLQRPLAECRPLLIAVWIC